MIDWQLFWANFDGCITASPPVVHVVVFMAVVWVLVSLFKGIFA